MSERYRTEPSLSIVRAVPESRRKCRKRSGKLKSSYITLCKNIQEQAADLADLAQDLDVILLIAHQCFSQGIQGIVHLSDDAIDTMTAAAVQEIFSRKFMGS